MLRCIGLLYVVLIYFTGLINVPGYKIDIYVSYLNGTLLAFLYRQLTMFCGGCIMYMYIYIFTVCGELRGEGDMVVVYEYTVGWNDLRQK